MMAVGQHAVRADESIPVPTGESISVQKQSPQGGQVHYKDAAAAASNDRGRSSAVYSFILSYYGRPLSVSGRPCYILPMFLFIYFFLWPPYFPALVNGGSRKFYTWWTLSVIREVTT